MLHFLVALTPPGPGGWLGYASWLWAWLWVSPLDLGVALGMRPGSGPGSGSPLLDLGVGLGMRPGSGPGSGSGPGLGPVLTLLAVVFSAYCVLGQDPLEQLGWSSHESSQRVSFGSGKSG